MRTFRNAYTNSGYAQFEKSIHAILKSLDAFLVYDCR